jgi:hypothetical protein
MVRHLLCEVPKAFEMGVQRRGIVLGQPLALSPQFGGLRLQFLQRRHGWVIGTMGRRLYTKLPWRADLFQIRPLGWRRVRVQQNGERPKLGDLLRDLVQVVCRTQIDRILVGELRLDARPDNVHGDRIGMRLTKLDARSRI